VLTGSYDYGMVALSVLIAILGSYTALDLGERVTFARGRSRLAWLIGGCVAMGIGAWSMHFVGMLAFRLPVFVQYDGPTSLLSATQHFRFRHRAVCGEPADVARR
jgi:NO-binding membrane sensor protein with MHYT domain